MLVFKRIGLIGLREGLDVEDPNALTDSIAQNVVRNILRTNIVELIIESIFLSIRIKLSHNC
ncbi:MAG TPA: hypothetical protein LFV92_05375 [Rickettsia endosymbiont of Ceroptres masudai]|nr:hypothetical protein [Rickettsia endosymbiont of Ceroptres masudai]